MLFKKILECAKATSILILDRNGFVLDTNKAFQMIFGYNKEDIVGKNFSILFIAKDLKELSYDQDYLFKNF